MAKISLRPGFRLVVLLLGLWFALDLVSHLVAESLWFQEVGYLQVFWLQLRTRGVLWAVAFSVTASFLLGNLALAQQLKHPAPQGSGEVKGKLGKSQKSQAHAWSRAEHRSPTGFGICPLLLLVLGLGLLLGVMLFHYTQVAASYWHPEGNLLGSLPSLPPRFQPEAAWQIWRQLSSHSWQLGLLLGWVLALALAPRFWLTALAVLLSLGFGLILSGQWARVLQYFYPTPFNQTEPLFGQDISFYTFSLPVWELLEFWLMGLFLCALAAATLSYLLSGNSLSEGRFPGFTPAQLRHLQALAGCLMLAIAFSHWLNRYRLFYSTRGVTYGASYTDVTVQLPAETGLSFLSLVLALMLFWRALVGSKQMVPFSPMPQYCSDKPYFLSPCPPASSAPSAPPACLNRQIFSTEQYCPMPLLAACLYLVGAVLGGTALPTAVQHLAVEPNELARERLYIERSIAFTRQAFDLDSIDVRTFNPEGQLTYADLQANDLTIRNIRLWDKRPLLQTNRQLQQIRLYYRFSDADTDRYTLKDEKNQRQERKQVLLAARELDYTAVPPQAQTWVNEHLVYTHGYGFTLSPVNTVGPGGLPDYLVRGIGLEAISEGLGTSSGSIPIEHPRIYYGQLSNTYVMAPTRVQELDYPSGEENVYNTYDGLGGVAIGPWWQRLLFAKYLNDWQMLLTRNFSPETKLLFRRNIKRRIRAIAPFLSYDRDPYLVVAAPNLYRTREEPQGISSDATKPPGSRNYLSWIADAYTTSDRYPYSDPGTDSFNYIRNSVKVVVDAYNGSVAFYITDSRDPMIQTWQRIFPDLFRPLEEMPATLRAHIRYPVDLFDVQSERLLTYHMRDSQVFYNREDQWQVPTEIYGGEPLPIEPYYLIMKLPIATSEEFILLRPFIPTSRNNLIAWLAASSDGNNYGKLLLYQFPKQRLIYGPQQIEARINQDPAISGQISLWNQQGSRVIEGHLLVIPIEQSLLYVEPLYLEAEHNSLPTLARVIVAYENYIAMAATLDQALDAIFRPETTEIAPEPAIVRPIEEVPPPGAQSR